MTDRWYPCSEGLEACWERVSFPLRAGDVHKPPTQHPCGKMRKCVHATFHE